MIQEKTIGILGGMGPYATLTFFKKLIDMTPAKKDWEHLRIIIDCNPKIPSRVLYLLYEKESPVPMMIETCKNLEKAGADFIVIPCNTAHHFREEIQEHIGIPILNMIQEVNKTIIHTMPSIKKIGLLATEATSRGPLYRESLKREGIDVIAPPPNSHEEKRVRRIIEDVKLNKINKTTKKEIISLCNWLKAKGAEAVILGCTEIPAAISPSELNIPAFDSIHIYAQATVQKAREGSN